MNLSRVECDELCSSLIYGLILADQLNNEENSQKLTKEPLIIKSINVTDTTDFSVDPSRHIPKEESLINYGAVSKNLSGHETKTFYLTTAIAYTNGYPHIGHAYEFVTSDILVRYHRILGFDTYFLTGSDEHGQKVAASAEKAGLQPLAHCDIYVNAFKALNQRLAVTCSQYIRTTDPYHEQTAQRLWVICSESGDIYLDTYEGWYNEREEVFVTEMEAEAAEYKDAGSGLPLKRVREESYFFRMSNYLEPLIAHIENNPNFIQPEQFRTNILSRLKAEGLKDLSLSRTSFTWGIPMPSGFDSKHVMYVWFDALSNYLSGVHALDKDHPDARYWPANRHIIGKDIVWFHCVIWPCMLMSAKIALPDGVFSHGFVNAADGRKMSKSYNNAVDPHEALDKYPLDSLRYYMATSTTYGTDLNFSETSLIAMHNSELADTLGNLVHRGLNLCIKFCDGVIPDTIHDARFSLPFDITTLIVSTEEDMKYCNISGAIFKVMEAVRATNKYLTDAEPWKMKGADEHRKPSIVRTTLEALYALAIFLAPVIPLTAGEMFRKLNTPPIPVTQLNRSLYNLKPGTPVTIGDILFQKIETSDTPASSASVTASNSTTTTTTTSTTSTTSTTNNKSKSKGAVTNNNNNNNKDGNKQSLEKTDKKPSNKSTTMKSVEKKEKGGDGDVANSNTEIQQSDFSKIDLRIGQIVKVWNHESAERLYCEEIDVGETSPRQVASGLREHYTLEQMQGRKLIVVCNLKEAKMLGFTSYGMVLASKSAEGKVELVSPPTDAKIGERIFLEGSSDDSDSSLETLCTPWSASRVKKYKAWEILAKDLKTNSECVACWQGKPLMTTSGKCIVESNADSPIA